MTTIQRLPSRLAHVSAPARLATLGRDEFEGYASLFGVPDSAGDVVAPGAFASSLRKRVAKARICARTAGVHQARNHRRCGHSITSA